MTSAIETRVALNTVSDIGQMADLMPELEARTPVKAL